MTSEIVKLQMTTIRIGKSGSIDQIGHFNTNLCVYSDTKNHYYVMICILTKIIVDNKNSVETSQIINSKRRYFPESSVDYAIVINAWYANQNMTADDKSLVNGRRRVETCTVLFAFGLSSWIELYHSLGFWCVNI